VRVARNACLMRETQWALELLVNARKGICSCLGRTQQWRMTRLVKGGHAVRVGRGRYVLNPKLWSDGSLPKHLLPDKFK
jgi:hypothetical protein